MIAGLVSAIVGFIELIVGLRFLFRLIGANPDNGIVNGIYQWSTPFVTPFAGIFGQDAIVAGQGAVTQSVFDWTALVALLVYGLIGAVIVRAVAGTRHH